MASNIRRARADALFSGVLITLYAFVALLDLGLGIFNAVKGDPIAWVWFIASVIWTGVFALSISNYNLVTRSFERGIR